MATTVVPLVVRHQAGTLTVFNKVDYRSNVEVYGSGETGRVQPQ